MYVRKANIAGLRDRGVESLSLSFLREVGGMRELAVASGLFGGRRKF